VPYVHDDAPADDVDPSGHFVQLDASKLSAYVPAGHSWHADPSVGEYFPAPQDSQYAAPARDDVPFGQTLHSVDEMRLLTVPAEHCKHEDPPLG
jgi:hypothetical protein